MVHHSINQSASRSLNIMCWNVNGLFRRVNGMRMCKLEEEDFRSKLSADISILVETHACENDVLKLDGYFCISNCRSVNISRSRGGVAIFVKESLRKGIQLVDRKHTDMIWIKLKKDFFGLEKDLYLNAVYISPIASSYTKKQDSDNDIFNKLETDIARYSRVGDIMLMGDLNAHINSQDQDFIVNESGDNLEDFMPNNYSIDNCHLMRNTQIPQTTNEYGKRIIDICVSSQLRILNGRTVGDSAGKATYHGYNGSSIDDYCICNSRSLKNIVSFLVQEFDVNQSDHCPILVKVRSFFCYQAESTYIKCPRSFTWDEKKKYVFMNNLSKINVVTLKRNIEHIAADHDKSNCEKVDEIIKQLNEVLQAAAELTLSEQRDKYKHKKRHRKKIKKKTWFDNECMALNKHLKSLSRRISQKPFDKELRSKIYESKKKYKAMIRKKHRTYKHEIMHKMLQNESKNPKAFWDSVNNLMERHKHDPSSDICDNDWIKHFQELLNQDYGNINEINLTDQDQLENSILNETISKKEIHDALNMLKNGKACGIDEISNEMLKLSSYYMIDHYVWLFNFILKSSIFPTTWRINIIKPIYKGGGTSDTSNYRGIALSSCFSKLLSRILFNRLDNYLESNNVLNQEQIGFRKKCRTSDHILTLKTLIDKAVKGSKHLYTSFVDLSKAFDTINRSSLIHKMKSVGINGPFMRLIEDMYRELYCTVKCSNHLSENFKTTTGVKQGCILSPTLFAIYMNDLVDNFDDSCDPVELNSTKVSCLMYADDIVLLSNSAVGLQNLLNKLEQFCDRWNLVVNVQKTKIMIFNKTGRLMKHMPFIYKNYHIELVNEYKYLGIIFKPSGTFTAAVKYLSNKALKAIFCIRQALESERSNTEIQLKLYEACVKPILLYCSEVWSLELVKEFNENVESRFEKIIPEKIQVKFCKYTLGLHKTATNNAVRGELGLYPLAISGIKNTINFWQHILESKDNSLIYNAFQESKLFSKGHGFKLKQALYYLGFGHVWENGGTFSKKRLSHAICEQIKHKYTLFWKKSINGELGNKTANKMRTYCKIKEEYKLEKYLIANDLDKHKVKTFTKLRISAHKLFIEEGRYKKIPVEQRVCKLCQVEVEDELHFVMMCNRLSNVRMDYFQKLGQIVPEFDYMQISEKFKFILQSKDFDLNNICINFIDHMTREREEYLTDSRN